MPECFKCHLNELPDGEGRAIEISGVHIALFRVGDEVFAIEEMCPHRGAPLSEGALHDFTIRCPWHDAKFEIRTGKVLTPPARRDLKTYPVSLSPSGEVEVRLS